MNQDFVIFKFLSYYNKNKIVSSNHNISYDFCLSPNYFIPIPVYWSRVVWWGDNQKIKIKFCKFSCKLLRNLILAIVTVYLVDVLQLWYKY